MSEEAGAAGRFRAVPEDFVFPHEGGREGGGQSETTGEQDETEE